MDYLLRLENSEDAPETVRGSAVYPAGHRGFDGHFPGNPLLPAFLHIQTALDMLRLSGRPADLLRVEGAKFLRPIRPEEAIAIELTPTAAGAYDAALSVAGEPCGRFHLCTQPVQESPRL